MPICSGLSCLDTFPCSDSKNMPFWACFWCPFPHLRPHRRTHPKWRLFCVFALLSPSNAKGTLIWVLPSPRRTPFRVFSLPLNTQTHLRRRVLVFSLLSFCSPMKAGRFASKTACFRCLISPPPLKYHPTTASNTKNAPLWAHFLSSLHFLFLVPCQNPHLCHRP